MEFKKVAEHPAVWIDYNNNNTWNCSEYTYKQALAASKTMVTCFNCHNSVDCYDCHLCHNCNGCTFCHDCRNLQGRYAIEGEQNEHIKR